MLTSTLTARLSEILRAPARTISPSAPLRQLASELAEDPIGLLVVHGADGRPVGVVSERDLVRAVAEGEDLDLCRVVDIMSDRIVAAPPSLPLHLAAGLMADADVRHLVVLDRHGFAAGVVSTRDITAAVSRTS